MRNVGFRKGDVVEQDRKRAHKLTLYFVSVNLPTDLCLLNLRYLK